jgi:hypothetical protein
MFDMTPAALVLTMFCKRRKPFELRVRFVTTIFVVLAEAIVTENVGVVSQVEPSTEC